jgi:hypothetical protein
VPRPASLLIVLVLAACANPSAPSSEPSPLDSGAAEAPGRMVVEPDRARPGELVEVRFPDGADRGLLYALDASAGDGWDRLWMLISNANGAEPLWFPNGEEVAVEAIGIVGEGPDRLQIPNEAAPGRYRVCTANAAENLCAPIDIVAP